MPKIPTGLMKRKNSDVWQGRFRIPNDLWTRRDQLTNLGVRDIGKSQEFTKSTKEHDPKKAQLVYSQKKVLWDQQMDLWRRILERSPVDLSHAQLVALASQHGRKFVGTYEADPFDAPVLRPIDDLELGPTPLGASIPQKSQTILASYIKVKTTVERNKTLQIILSDHPELEAFFQKSIETGLEELVGTATDDVLSEHRLNIDQANRKLLNLEMLSAVGKAERTLEDRQSGDYTTMHGLEKAPEFKAEAGLAATFTSVIERQRVLANKRLDNEYKSEATLRKAVSVSNAFSKWRGSDLVGTIRYVEVERWRDELLQGSGSNTTTRHKISMIKSLINWAIRHNKRDIRAEPSTPQLLGGTNPVNGLELPTKALVNAEDRTFSIPVAAEILRRSNELPEEFVFVPWLQAYSGARINEVMTLEKRDVSEYEGIWYFEIRDENAKGAGGKLGRGRRVPLHHSIIERGFLEYIKDIPVGLIFNQRKVLNITGRYREVLLRVMIKDGKSILDGKPPTHAWRHLFADISEGKLSRTAQYYIEGRSERTSRDHYGKSLALLPELAKMINKIDSLR